MSRRQVQQLAGKINFLPHVCRQARLFMARVLAYLRAHPPGYTTISQGARADMRWFLSFLPLYNGISIIPEPTPSSIVEADSCMVGGGAIRGHICYSFHYPEQMTSDHHISQLEAINCMAAVRVLIGPQDCGKLIEIHCDNLAAVSVYHTGRGRDSVILACARAIWAHAAISDCSLTFKHIPGELMGVADTLSRVPISMEAESKAFAMCQLMCLDRINVEANAFHYSAFL